MKKLIVFFSLISTLFLGLEVHASNNEDSNLYVQTEIVTPDFSDYANSNFFTLLQAKLIQDDIDLSEANNYSLGSPFSVIYNDPNIKTFYYPVLKNNNIVYTYLLNKDSKNDFTGQLSEFLVNELRNLQNRNITDTKTPITFYGNGSDIYYRYNNKNILFYSAPVEPEQSVELNEINLDESNIKNLEIVNLEDEQNFDNSSNFKSSNPLSRTVSTAYNYSMIDFKISETQGNNSWCAAYAAAGILNNKNDKRATNAQTIMKWKYGNLAYNTLKDKSINQADLVSYANTKKVYPKIVESKLSVGEVRNQLNKSNAIYAGARGTGTYSGARHAFVIYGWLTPDTGQNLYYVWNPWWNYPSVIDASKGTLPVNGGSFIWDKTITNW